MLALKKPLKRRAAGRDIKDNMELYAMMLPVLILIFVFSYVPMFGLVIAFQNYVPGAAFLGEGVQWVGLKHFADFVGSFYFPRIIRNTLVLSLLGLAAGFWVPIAFSLLLNELVSARFKKFVQTASYLPHFISSVVVAGMVLSFVANDGVVFKALELLGVKPRPITTNPGAFPWIYTLTNIWKTFGWSSILYLSTISSIDPALYEAAEIDGANRWRQVWHVTVPFMVPLIVIQLIFAVGAVAASNTELILLLYNPATYSTSDVIGTYVYREGLLGGKFSYGTASGMLMGVISFLLVYGSNRLSGKLTDYSLW